MQKEYLICVDSDGCVMDTMTFKHQLIFGPLLIKYFNLQDQEQAIMKYWLNLNLTSARRGLNRFQGALATLKRFDPNIEGLAEYEAYINESKIHNIETLKSLLPNTCVQKIINWSQAVNVSVKELQYLAKPFDASLPFIKEISKIADIWVVSSANQQALEAEWSHFGLLSSIKKLNSQEAGTKKVIIEKALELGYEPSKCLMIGDAIGDYQAALANNIAFYPILVNQENDSWYDLIYKYYPLFIKEGFNELTNTFLIERFKNNFEGEL